MSYRSRSHHSFPHSAKLPVSSPASFDPPTVPAQEVTVEVGPNINGSAECFVQEDYHCPLAVKIPQPGRSEVICVTYIVIGTW